MEGTAARPAREKAVNPGTVSPQRNTAVPPLAARPESAAAMSVGGYGMPCAKCRAYYPADMAACPICHARERVLPAAGVQAAGAQNAAVQTPAPSDHARLLVEEREKLRELKSQIYASQSQVGPSTFRCALDHNHDGNVEPAAICHSCYTTAREQADRMEAALHMDSREAAKIVYEAVWADTSDPSKTYMNAANALLSELRARAGIAPALGTKQAPAH